jgi:hypothetical protein
MAIKGQVVAVIGVDYFDRLFYDHIRGQVYKSGPVQCTSRMWAYYDGPIGYSTQLFNLIYDPTFHAD